MQKYKYLWDIYRFPGFYPEHTVCGVYGDPRARVIGLLRRGKKLFVGPVAKHTIPSTTEKSVGFETSPVETCGFIWIWRSAEWIAQGVRK
jgi:hypothetical protein